MDLTQRRQGAKTQKLRRKYPEGITSFSPVLTDDLPRRSETKVGIGLRWVTNHKFKSTLNGLNQNVATAMQPRWG
jgi:hypothetical protein